MRQEYRFDYRKSRPNRFALHVASVFRSTESVNSLLRSVITALPKQAKTQLKSG
jgi:hypothetical protein